MSELQERATKRLAELKAYLEKRVGEAEEEIKTLRSFLEVVDALLAERSYRRVEVPKTVIEATPLATQAGPQTIRTISGVHLASLHVEGPDLRVVPSESIKFEVSAPPLRAFLVGRVLEPMQTRDVEAAQKGELSADRVLSFKLDQEGNLLKQIHVKNYGDDRRLNEIRNAVRWTLRRMYEKTIGT